MSVVKSWLESDPSFRKFRVLMQRNKLMPSTVLNHGKYVKSFCHFRGAESPSQALADFKELPEEERVQVVDDYVQHSLDRGVNSSTVVQMYRSLKKWLQLNGVTVDWLRIQQEILPGEEIIVSDRKPTKAELLQILNLGKLRDKVMVLMLVSSGLRIGTLASLSLGEVELEQDPCAIVVVRKPGRKVSRKLGRYVTFISPEAKKLLLEYLEWRRKEGEAVTDSSPVLTSDRKSQMGQFLTSMYLSNHWRRLLRRAHLATKNGGPWHDIHLHTLRKFFETQCVNAGVKTAYREHWMGHTGRHLESSYFRGGRDKHVEEYKKAVPFLSLTAPKPRDYQDLVDKVRFLEANGKRKDLEIQRLMSQASKVEQIERELATMKKAIQHLTETLSGE